MGRIPRYALAFGLLCVVAAFQIGTAAQAGPSVAARDQRLTNNTVVVESVIAPEPGWVDVHAEAEVAGNPGAVIGYAPVQPGENTYVLVSVDPAKVTPVLYAVLHVDRGQPGVFEFPGTDEPVKVDGKSVTASFHVLNEQARPSSEAPGLSVRDQALRNGEVIIGQVIAAQAGWVDIHAEAEQAGNPGPVIGYSPVAVGETTYLRVPVPADKVTPVLYAVLHLDEGEPGRFEFPGPDTPVQRDGHSIVAPFHLVQSGSQAAVTPASSPTRATTPTETAAGAEPSAMPTVTVAATQMAAPAAAATPTVTATQTAAPSSTLTPIATATGTAAPSATPSATETATLTSSPTTTPTSEALGGSGTALPSATPSPSAAVAGQGSGLESFPLTGGGSELLDLLAPVAAGLSILLLLVGLALRRGWSQAGK